MAPARALLLVAAVLLAAAGGAHASPLYNVNGGKKCRVRLRAHGGAALPAAPCFCLTGREPEAGGCLRLRGCGGPALPPCWHPIPQYLSPTAVNEQLRAKGVSNAAAVQAVIDRLKGVQNWVCQECNPKLGVEAKFTDAVVTSYSECCGWRR
jgi:hypothetical protein